MKFYIVFCKLKVFIFRKKQVKIISKYEYIQTPIFSSDLVNKLGTDLAELKKELELKRRENSGLLYRIQDLENRCHIQRAKDATYHDVQTSPGVGRGMSPQRANVTSPEQVTSPLHANLSSPQRIASPQRANLASPERGSPNRMSSGSPTRRSGHWSPSGGSVSPDFDIPLNRQSLSDMSAPMLRRFIRQLQQQLNKLEQENMELKKQLDATGDYREIPGHSEEDASSFERLRQEIHTLTNQLFAKNREIRLLRDKLGLEGEGYVDFKALRSVKDLQNEIILLTSQLKKSEESCDWLEKRLLAMSKSRDSSKDSLSDSSTQTVNHHVTFAPVCQKVSLGGQGQKVKSSLIPRLQQRMSNQPVLGDHSHIDNPEVLKQLLTEARARILQIEDKLKVTITVVMKIS